MRPQRGAFRCHEERNMELAVTRLGVLQRDTAINREEHGGQESCPGCPPPALTITTVKTETLMGPNPGVSCRSRCCRCRLMILCQSCDSDPEEPGSVTLVTFQSSDTANAVKLVPQVAQ